MVRISLINLLVTMMTSTVAANVQDAKSDLAWTDIGDSIFQVKEEVKVQRGYDSIKQTEGLYDVGAIIRLAQDVNLRTQPAGAIIGPVLKGEEFQVLGVKLDKKRKRYYKIKTDKGFGYIYGGTKVTHAKWVKQSWATDKKLIALPGDMIKVKRKRGLKISKTPKDKSFYSIPRGSEIQVEAIGQNEDGVVFYKVKYKSRTGFANFGDTAALAKSKTWKEIY